MNASGDPPPCPGVEILIAEDSPTQALRLRHLLERRGYRVEVARHGGEALAALGARAGSLPALVISDVNMPEMDGFELCQRIKAEPALRELPVILLTTLSDPQDILKGLECGADNFIVKPFDEQLHFARIEAVLGNRELGGAAPEGAALPIVFGGQRYVIGSGRRQVLTLLLSTYETAVQKNLALLEAHEALKNAQAQLIEAEKLQSVGRLAAGVAHEVRNPLAIMEMGLGLLADEPVSEGGQMILGEMKEAVRRANEVIVGLMDLASPPALGMQPLDLNAMLERALTALADDLERARIAVVTDFAPGLPQPPVDASKTEQVLVNILSNARDAMPEGGTLSVRTSVQTLGTADVVWEAGDRSGARFREGDRAVVAEVRDAGHGVAPEHLGKVFEPFFSTKPTGTGMGLGLTVAKKIMDLHRGRIELRNGPEGGAIVTLMFKLP